MSARLPFVVAASGQIMLAAFFIVRALAPDEAALRYHAIAICIGAFCFVSSLLLGVASVRGRG